MPPDVPVALACREDMMSKEKGFIVWEGPSPVDGAPIVFLMTMRSSNRKTGDMVQTWILRQDVDPVQAIKAREDASVCGDCPHRGDAVTGVGRSCYVNAGQAPLAVFRSYQRGLYRRFTRKDWHLLSGRKIRFGAYGDPGMIPLDRIELLASLSDGWTGYTHQWSWIDPAFSGYLMASSDSVEDRRRSRLMGYRSFYVVPRGAERPDSAILCLSEAKGTSCLDCGACAGTRQGAVAGAVDVYIGAHGAGAKYV